jgi:hypothetical protein
MRDTGSKEAETVTVAAANLVEVQLPAKVPSQVQLGKEINPPVDSTLYFSYCPSTPLRTKALRALLNIKN